MPFIGEVKALIVGDGIVHFGPKDQTDETFTLSFFLETLANNKFPAISLTTAHRRADSNADLQNFNFAQHDLTPYDEIWLVGYEGTNDGAVIPGQSAIGQDEVVAIANFMQSGGGVFATGDHSGLGSFLCGQIPRVRSMRRWYDVSDAPPGYPSSWPGAGPDRADTTQPDHNNQYFFDNQSDDIPQPLAFPGGPADVHPILQGPEGAITQFPDHMHEGEAIVPWSLGDTLTFNGQSFVEYPAVAGYQEEPQIIAIGTVLPGHETPLEGNDAMAGFYNETTTTNPKQIGILCAYDGRTVNVGRVVTDSSFHHLLDLNLTGDPLGVAAKQKGFTTVAGEPILADLQAYYVNTAVWLARSLHFWSLINIVLALPWWWELFDPGGPVESDPSKILQYGSLMRQELARYVRDGMTVDWIAGSLRAEGLGELLPKQSVMRQRPAEAIAHHRGDVIAAVLGGATLAMMRARGAPSHRLDRAQAEAAARAGMFAGLRALGRLVRHYSQQSADLAGTLSHAGAHAHR